MKRVCKIMRDAKNKKCKNERCKKIKYKNSKKTIEALHIN